MPESTNALTIQTAIADESERNNIHKLLAELLITVEDQLFEGRILWIDGYRFINCSFKNCKLWILRGTFEFHHCIIESSTRIFGEGALKSIQLYVLASEQVQVAPDFRAKVYPDGSFTVAKGASM
jgi:hypothetical protein